MLSYSLTVGYFPSVTTCTIPAAPPSPLPDSQASFRCSCLAQYHVAILSGLDHVHALREVCRLLRLSGHPWHSFEVVAHEVNSALGRRRGRPAKSVRS